MDEQKLKDILKRFEDHELLEEVAVKRCRVWRLRVPGKGSMMMTQITETSCGELVISGDYCPEAGSHGCVSTPGYNADWFVGLESGSVVDYGASKFLKKEFVPSRALAYIRELGGDQGLSGDGQKDLDDLAEQLRGGELGAEGLYIKGIDSEVDYGLLEDISEAAWGYNPHDVEALQNIQVVFRDRWLKMYPQEEVD